MKPSLLRPLLRLLAGVALTAALPGGLAAQDDPVAAALARARAYIGPEEALRAVQSIHYLATWTNDEGVSHELDVVVRKPMHQRVIEVLQDGRDIKVLDEYEGWRLRERTGTNEAGVLTLLSAPEVRHMRAEAWQNLNFYGNIELVSGRIEYEGEVEIEGVLCDKLVFIHPRDIRHTRYFDRTTGRLVLAELSSGSKVVLTGELMADGIRFAKEQVMSGNGRAVTIVFNKITLNEEFPDSLFKMPILRPRARALSPAPAPVRPPTPAGNETPTAPAPPTGPSPDSSTAPAPEPPAPTTPPPPAPPAPTTGEAPAAPPAAVP